MIKTTSTPPSKTLSPHIVEQAERAKRSLILNDEFLNVKKDDEFTGKRFGKLTVVGRAMNNKHRQSRWYCVCSCGNRITVIGNNLKNKNTQSCGCLRRQD